MEPAKDYAAFTARPTDELFAKLANLVSDQIAAERAVEHAEAALTTAQERLRRVSEVELPEFMENTMGLSETTTRDGVKVKIKEVVRAGITKERAAKALNWLRANGAGALIKRVVSVQFTKGQDANADELTKVIHAAGFEPEDGAGVHAQTLGAWVREKLEAGKLPDEALELLGVHRQKFTKLG